MPSTLAWDGRYSRVPASLASCRAGSVQGFAGGSCPFHRGGRGRREPMQSGGGFNGLSEGAAVLVVSVGLLKRTPSTTENPSNLPQSLASTCKRDFCRVRSWKLREFPGFSANDTWKAEQIPKLDVVGSNPIARFAVDDPREKMAPAPGHSRPCAH
jgi:hypothetical protein